MGADTSEEAVMESVLAAGDSIKVEGVTYRLSPIPVGRLAEIQKEALRDYKRQYLETYADTSDLGDGFDEARKEVAGWSYKDLPSKLVYDATKIKITTELRELMTEKFGELPASDESLQGLIGILLDQGSLEPSDLGGSVPSITTSYPLWWTTSTLDGQILMTWHSVSIKHSDVTLEDVKGWPPLSVMEGAVKAESLTAPSSGNM